MIPRTFEPRPDYVKVRIDDNGMIETLWAQQVPGREDRFRLDNAPFFAYRVSADDVVEARLVADGVYEFIRVVRPSGNRTLRLIFGEDTADSPVGKQICDRLIAFGCSYEGMHGTLLSITAPQWVQLSDLATYLTSTDLEWEYADPTYEDLFGGTPP